MFITPAFAQGAGGTDALFNLFVPFALIIVIFYILILRPQQRRQREHRELVASLRRGDTVVTSGGFIGKVSKVIDDSELQVELAPDVKVRILRQMVSEVRSKNEPVKDKK